MKGLVWITQHVSDVACCMGARHGSDDDDDTMMVSVKMRMVRWIYSVTYNPVHTLDALDMIRRGRLECYGLIERKEEAHWAVQSYWSGG